MRILILVIFLIAIAYIITDPRWDQAGASSIAAPWQGGSELQGVQPVHTVYLTTNERCAYVAAWLSSREKNRVPIDSGELAAASRVLDSCDGG